MSSDGYFSDLDADALGQVDAIEAAALDPGPSTSAAPARAAQAPARPTAQSSGNDSYFDDLTLDIDEIDFQRLDDDIEIQLQAPRSAAPRSLSRVDSRNTVQTTLFGGRLPPSTTNENSPSTSSRGQMQRTKSAQQRAPLFGRQPTKTKMWDHTEFAKTGLKRGASKNKGKEKEVLEEEMLDEDETMEFEQFPAPFMPVGPPAPMKLQFDPQEIQSWIYPLNHPKRDYQFNIVKSCFFDNTLVCLPTGLGKTFIAGVVMLNFWRWFPEGKIVFVAPTKPLVAQQIDACHQTCGIPGAEAAELTGGVPKAARARAWYQKRVFYMTPQTLLNDLVQENCDARDIILLVIDEAHRGTGDYAYSQVLRYLMSKNTHFRVLALSATPGGNPEAVQSVVDSLHISRIEARDEQSLDIKPYLHQKDIKQHIVHMTPEIDKIKGFLVKLMEPALKAVQQFIPGHVDLEKMNPFRAMAVIPTLRPNCKWAISGLMKLANLARALSYLIEGTTGMCYSYLKELASNEDESSAKKSKTQKLTKDPIFQALMAELDSQRSNETFSVHPKLDLLKTLLIQHLGQRLPDNEGEAASETKVMIFVSFREAVEEVTAALNQEQPMIRASKFIGQGTDKKGNRGMSQKEQLNVIQQFKKDVFNVLVATSIGEEGLDIGEVDLIVCYDAQKSSIRMLQRIGRTGRKRNGHVHVLLAEYREELNFEKAKDSHKHVLKSIWKGVDYELYGDVDRLIPPDIKPVCVEKVMEIQEYDREAANQRNSRAVGSPSRGKKRKRNDDVGRNIPKGAADGFVSVADLVKKGSKKRKVEPKLTASDIEAAGIDDDDDMELEAGFACPLQRSATATAGSSTAKKKPVRKTKSATTAKPTKKNKKKAVADLASQELRNLGSDDEADNELGKAPLFLPECSTDEEDEVPLAKSLSSKTSLPSSPPCLKTDFEGGGSPSHRSSSAEPFTVAVSPIPYTNGHSPLPLQKPSRSLSATLSASDRSPPPPQRSTSPPQPAAKVDQSIAWLIDDDDEPDIEIVSSSPVISRNNSTLSILDESVQVIDDHNVVAGPSTTAQGAAPVPVADRSVLDLCSSPHLRVSFAGGYDSQEDADADMGAPEPTYHPTRPGRRRVVQTMAQSSSPAVEISSRAPRRIRRRTSSSPVAAEADAATAEASPTQPRRRRRVRRSGERIVLSRHNQFFVSEADHSGDNISEGESNAEEDFENSSDREFTTEMPATQANPDYSQARIYQQSLLSQAPPGWGNGGGPAFQGGVIRRGAFGVRRSGVGGWQGPQNHAALSSSPPRPDSELDEYEMGSFIVEDDDLTQDF